MILVNYIDVLGMVLLVTTGYYWVLGGTGWYWGALKCTAGYELQGGGDCRVLGVP